MSRRTFRVWAPDLGQTEDDAKSFKTYSAESATTLWAERYDAETCEYSIVAGRDQQLSCLEVDSGDVIQLTVSGESVAHYRARKIT
jgi:hypothetical protein